MPKVWIGLLCAGIQLPGLIAFYILARRDGSPVQHVMPTRIRMGTAGIFDLIRMIGVLFLPISGADYPTLRAVQLVCRTLLLAVLAYAVWDIADWLLPG